MTRLFFPCLIGCLEKYLSIPVFLIYGIAPYQYKTDFYLKNQPFRIESTLILEFLKIELQFEVKKKACTFENLILQFQKKIGDSQPFV